LAGKLVRVNPALVQMLGYDSAEDLLSIPASTAPYRNPSVTKKIVAECIRNGRVDTTVDWKRKDGAISTAKSAKCSTSASQTCRIRSAVLKACFLRACWGYNAQIVPLVILAAKRSFA
jgi:PAS domain-containing protein